MTTSDDPRPTILIDSSEADPLRFSPAVDVQCCALDIGQYSVRGCVNRAAIDRVSLEGFIRAALHERDALFDRCRRLAQRDTRAVVLEASRDDVRTKARRFGATPEALFATMSDLRVSCGVRVVLGRTRMGAARCIERILTDVWLEQRQRIGLGPYLPVITGGAVDAPLLVDDPDGEPMPLGAA